MGVLVFCPYKEIYLGQNFLIRQNIFCRRPSKLGGPENKYLTYCVQILVTTHHAQLGLWATVQQLQ